MQRLWLKRAYDLPDQSDGQRILVDRLWPRGVSKTALELDGWMKDIAPSNELRRWYGHDPDKWDEFKQRYARELDNQPDAVSAMRVLLEKGCVTLVYATRDEEHAHARFLKDYLERVLDEG